MIVAPSDSSPRATLSPLLVRVATMMTTLVRPAANAASRSSIARAVRREGPAALGAAAADVTSGDAGDAATTRLAIKATLNTRASQRERTIE
jgi:hypothetical protein